MHYLICISTTKSTYRYINYNDPCHDLFTLMKRPPAPAGRHLGRLHHGAERLLHRPGRAVWRPNETKIRDIIGLTGRLCIN